MEKSNESIYNVILAAVRVANENVVTIEEGTGTTIYSNPTDEQIAQEVYNQLLPRIQAWWKE